MVLAAGAPTWRAHHALVTHVPCTGLSWAVGGAEGPTHMAAPFPLLVPACALCRGPRTPGRPMPGALARRPRVQQAREGAGVTNPPGHASTSVPSEGPTHHHVPRRPPDQAGDSSKLALPGSGCSHLRRSFEKSRRHISPDGESDTWRGSPGKTLDTAVLKEQRQAAPSVPSEKPGWRIKTAGRLGRWSSLQRPHRLDGAHCYPTTSVVPTLPLRGHGRPHPSLTFHTEYRSLAPSPQGPSR